MPQHTASEQKKNRNRKKRKGFRSPGPTRRDIGSFPRNQSEPQGIARTPLRLVGVTKPGGLMLTPRRRAPR